MSMGLLKKIRVLVDQITRVAFVTLLFYASGHELKAATTQGISVYYQHLGYMRYRLMADVYRACSGIGFPSSFKGTLRSGTCSTAITLTRDSIREIRNGCNNKSVCIPNSSSGFGLEVQRYSLLVDFSLSPYNAFTQSSCCDVQFVLEDGSLYRPSLSSLSSNNVYAACSLSLCRITGLKSGNSSAIPEFPISTLVWYNQPNQVSMFSLDPDGDSLAYSLAKPRITASTYCTFNSGYSETNPISTSCPGSYPCTPAPTSNPPRGFYLDPVRGDLIFQPMMTSETGLICVEITEYRRDSSGKMQKVGSTLHERIVLCTNSYNNNVPVISLPDATDACTGIYQCYSIQIKDKKFSSTSAPDTLRLKWNGSLSGMSVNTVQTLPNEATVQVCLTAMAPDTLPNAHFFTVWADDNFCPNPARAQQTLRFRVLKKPDCRLRISNSPGSRLIYELESNQSKAQYSVALRGPNKFFRNIKYTKNKVIDTIQLPDPGLYYLDAEISVPGYCTFTLKDSLKMEGCLKVKELNPGRNPACATLPVLFRVSVSGSVGKLSYRWSDGRGNNLSLTDSLKLLPVRDTLIRLLVNDQVGCAASTQLNLRSYLPKISYQSPAVIFCSEGAVFEWPVITAVNPPEVQFSSSLAGLAEARNGSYFTSNFIKLRSGVSQLARIRMSYTDSAGCPVQDSFQVTVNPSPHSNMRNDTLCKGTPSYALLNLIQDINLLKNSYVARCYAGPTSNLEAVVNGGNMGRFMVSGLYSLEFKTSNRNTGCAANDSFHVQLFQPPVYNLLTPDSPCALSTAVTLNKFVQVNTVTPVITWKAVAFDGNTKDPLLGNVISNGDHFFPAKAGNWLLAFRESSTYCPLNDTIKLNVRPLPQPIIGADTAINLDGILNLTPGLFSEYRWDDGQVGSTRMVKAQNLGIGKHLIWVRVSDMYSCSASDSLYLQVRPIGTGSKAYESEPYRYYPNPFNTRLYLNLPEKVNKVTLYTVNGQKVEVPVEIVKGFRVFHTDSLPSGLYVLAIEEKTGVQYFRLTKQTP